MHTLGSASKYVASRPRREGQVLAAFCTNEEAFVNTCASLVHTDGLNGIYVVMNPFEKELPRESLNTLQSYPKNLTKNDDITVRRWILIDADPQRDPLRSEGTGARGRRISP